MNPVLDLLEQDTAAVLADALGGGEEVTLESAEGHTAVVRAFFEMPGVETTPGTASAPILSAGPMLHIPMSVLHTALGRPLTTRDQVLVRGTRYRITRPLDDGFGLLACKLLEVGHADLR